MPYNSFNCAVVITAFNRAAFIRAAVDSALSQTCPPNEVIVVDDGSTDRTAQIVSAYAPAVHLIRIENNGVGQTRPLNIGIAAVRAEYVMLLDSDDRLHPRAVERHMRVIGARARIGLVSCNFVQEIHSRNGGVKRTANVASLVQQCKKEVLDHATYLIHAHEAYAALCRGNFLRSCSGNSFPKRVWEEVHGFDETIRTCTDMNFFFRVLKRYDLVYIDEPLRTLICHNANVSHANITRKNVPAIHMDHLQVLYRELRGADSSEHRRLLKQRIRESLFELAYGLRKSGDYRGSLDACFRYIASGGSLASGLIAVVKVPASWLQEKVAN